MKSRDSSRVTQETTRLHLLFLMFHSNKSHTFRECYCNISSPLVYAELFSMIIVKDGSVTFCSKWRYMSPVKCVGGKKGQQVNLQMSQPHTFNFWGCFRQKTTFFYSEKNTNELKYSATQQKQYKEANSL